MKGGRIEPSPAVVETIFTAASVLPVGERPGYLAGACRGNTQLRCRVEALLRAQEAPEGFLPEQPGPAPARSPILPTGLAASIAGQPGDRIGPYKLLQKIDEGGCGVVYLAEQEEPVRRKVALKVIKLGMDTKQVVARFEAERQALALMDHPNIAKVLDAGATDTGRPYFVMELVGGIKITDYCDQNHLTTRQRLDLFIQVCRAVQHAHQKGIIHRDLKPSNVLVAMQDGVAVPKVIDFGIAKATQGRLTDQTVFTAFEQFLGTPAYMSPEQAQVGGLDVDTRSDIYSLGVLLYELLTGKTPFDAKELLAAGLEAMRRTIQEKEPPTPSTRLAQELKSANQPGPSTLNPQHLKQLVHLLRGDLDWIVMKCLEKDRARRYETANGLARDIERHLNQEPVLASPPGRVYRIHKFIRRNRLMAASATAVATVLVLGVAGSTWQAIRATQAEREQNRLRRQAETAQANEVREREIAQKAASQSQQVAQLLKDMLAGVGPSVALGRDTTMLREILNKTAERISKDLTNQPAVEMQLRNVLAGSYHELELYERMEAMASEAVRLGRAHDGGTNPELADALDLFGDAKMHIGALSAAEAALREALVLKERLFGHPNESVATSLSHLSDVLRMKDRLPEAEEAAREAIAIRQELLGKEHLDVAEALRQLAMVLNSEDKLAESEALHREILAMVKRLLGIEHPIVAKALTDLAGVLAQQGKLAEAELLSGEAVTMSRRLGGSDNVAVATPLLILGEVLLSQGKLVEAEQRLREALALYRKVPDNENPLVARSLSDLGVVMQGQSKPAESEALHREALAMRRKLFGNDHRVVAVSVWNLACVLQQQGRLPEAESFHREALAIRRKLLGDNHPDVVQSMLELILSLEQQEKFAEAEPILRQCLALRETELPDDWRTFNTRSRLGGCLLRQAKYSEAEPLLLSGYEGMKEREATIPEAGKPRLLEALQRLVQIFESTRRSDQASGWKKKLEDFERTQANRVKLCASPKP